MIDAMIHRRGCTLLAAWAIGMGTFACPTGAQVTNGSPPRAAGAAAGDNNPARPPATTTPGAATGGVRPTPPGRPGAALAGNDAAPNGSDRGDADAAVRVLETKVDDVLWDNEPFESIIEWLRTQGQANVIPVWRALDDIGVRRSDVVSLQLHDVTVHTVLVEVCDQLSLYGEVGFVGHGNIIKISSQKHLDRQVYVRVYNVHDLVFEVGEFICPYMRDDVKLGAAVQTDNYRTIEARMAALAEMLRDTIDADRWVENGGDCALSVYETSLVVRAPISVHQKLTGAFYLP